MKKTIPLLLLLFALFSCAGKKKIIIIDTAGGDGSSYEQAIIINETREGPGTDGEYAWIKQHYPHSSTAGQALTFVGKIPYDIITVENKGKTFSVYFNISKFYGKFNSKD